MKSKLVYFLLILIFSCKSENKALVNSGKYHLESNFCKTIQFLDEERVFITLDCKEHAVDDVIMKQNLDGEIIDLFCFDTLVYTIDSIDISNGKYISTYDRKGNKCNGLHIVDYEDYWIITPLKQGENIDYHFTESVTYLKENKKVDLNFDRNLTIRLRELSKDSIFYLAYSQDGHENWKEGKSGNITVDLQSDGDHYKTGLEINPAFYALKKYQFQLWDKRTKYYKSVPVMYHQEYTYYKTMNGLEKQDFHKEKGIIDNFIVVNRFNPGRVRVVNEIYKKNIIGQVQIFKFVTLSGSKTNIF